MYAAINVPDYDLLHMVRFNYKKMFDIRGSTIDVQNYQNIIY